jgi:predicted GNAT family acetyltransferase
MKLKPTVPKVPAKGTTKVTHSQQHDFDSTDEAGKPITVKKEAKKTTVVKHKDDSGPIAKASQRKQMKELC